MQGLKKLERETGFEPATSTLARSHSTTELLPLVMTFYSTCAFGANFPWLRWSCSLKIAAPERLNGLLKNSVCAARPLKGHLNFEDLWHR